MKLAALIEDLGFSPQAEADDGGQYQRRLRLCPFSEIAQHHQAALPVLMIKTLCPLELEALTWQGPQTFLARIGHPFRPLIDQENEE